MDRISGLLLVDFIKLVEHYACHLRWLKASACVCAQRRWGLHPAGLHPIADSKPENPKPH